MSGLRWHSYEDCRAAVPARDFEKRPLKLRCRLSTIPIVRVVFDKWHSSRYYTITHRDGAENRPNELHCIVAQEGSKFFARKPLIINREPRRPPIRLNVADVPIIVLSNDFCCFENLAHIGVPMNLIRLFQDEIHMLLARQNDQPSVLGQIDTKVAEL